MTTDTEQHLPTIDIVFSGEGPHLEFVEIESPPGTSIGDVGEWVQREDGYSALRIPDPRRMESLLDSERELIALQVAGVDNWSGYEYAMEALNG